MREMVEDIVQKIMETELRDASPEKLSAIGGVLNALYYVHPDVPEQLRRVRHEAFRRLWEAKDDSERHEWFIVYDHLHVQEAFTVFDITFDEYDKFDDYIDEYEQWQLTQIKDLTDGASQPWADRPLAERQRLLQIFYRQDINKLSHGDDTKAKAMLQAADSCYEQCCKEEVRLFEAMDMDAAEGSDLWWQYQEMMWHDRMESEHHYDQSLLPRLSLADSEAMSEFRLWCYTWILDKDPAQDYSVQTDADVKGFAAQAKDRLWSWLQVKNENGIAIPIEKEAEVLLTLCCVNNLSRLSSDNMFDIVERSYDYLFDRLPEGRLRTHLLAQVATYNEDDDLFPDIQSQVDAWSESTLTQEDRYLIEFLEPVCFIIQ